MAKTRRSASSRRWLKEHFDDPYVQKAKAEGWRSRAVYKRIEIDGKDRLLRPGMTVVDLGAAPGGWSQYARDRVGPQGRVVALDILPMDELPGVDFVLGDFREEAVLAQLLEVLGERPVDLLLSDMAPNTSGLKDVDRLRSALLAELALELAERVVAPGGDLLVKVFQGEGFDPLLRQMRARFDTVRSRKPEASRSRSSELYLLARGRRL